ncbi:MAG: hypothetical protein ACYCQJ_13555 [Nitrososphaerales archaeon]
MDPSPQLVQRIQQLEERVASLEQRLQQPVFGPGPGASPIYFPNTPIYFPNTTPPIGWASATGFSSNSEGIYPPLPTSSTLTPASPGRSLRELSFYYQP